MGTTRNERATLGLTMILALGFGFLHHLVPDYVHDFDRLHVFLFNLCAGGTVLVHEAEGRGRSPWLWPYFGLSLVFALAAFVEQYAVSIGVALALLLVVERVRIRRFGSFFPGRFFRAGSPADKFLEAAMLCLSIGLGISALVMLNHAYFRVVHLEKLTLDVFFLGFSFPLSLLTMSVMFRLADEDQTPLERRLRELAFWSITLGVIVFFLFIIFELPAAEIVIASLLLCAVCLVFWLFAAHSRAAPRQQRAILLSGLGFLLASAAIGVAYLFVPFFPALGPLHEHGMAFHATLALYGWNLSGLFIVLRWHDFPVGRRVWPAILLHWAVAGVLAPTGRELAAAAALALPAHAVLVSWLLLGRSRAGAERPS